MKCIKLVAEAKSHFWATVFIQKAFIILVFLVSWQVAEAALTLSLNPKVGVPTAKVTVKGTGFSANEKVDVYFDTQGLCLKGTNGAGAFSCTLQVPREAISGNHWVTAVGRTSGFEAQKSFLVRVNWSQFHYGPQHRGYNPYENVLSAANVGNLKEAWSYTTGDYIWSSPAVANGVV